MNQETKTFSIDEMKNQVAVIKELREQEKKASDVKKEITAQLESQELKMLEMLKASELSNFKTDLGLVAIMHRLSVKVPKAPEDKEAFFAYLKAQGLFDQMITVNSLTLNSFYKEQFELAKERGEEDFKIPGINEETMTEILSFRKA